MCAPDLRYKTIEIAAGTLTVNGLNAEVTNKIANVSADFTLSISKVRNGSIHHLILIKTVPGDVTITTGGADMVLGSGLGATIKLSGNTGTKFQLVITNDGSVNCIRSLSASVDLSTYATQTYVTTAVNNAVAALVNSSPAALDTLSELAAALGSDPNFATTITNALANKLDKTINVQRKDGTVVAYTLQASDNGSVIIFTAATPIAVLLPKTLPVGFNVGIVQEGAGQITFNVESGASLVNSYGYTKTRTTNSNVSLFIALNADSLSAKYNLSGDGAV